jgi:CRP/FNR family transcriptional regulator, cyclic AMP receptor protein
MLHPAMKGEMISPLSCGAALMRDAKKPSLETRLRLLNTHPFFAALEPADLERLSSYVRSVQVDRGEILFRKGDPGQSLFIVVEGLIKIGVPAADGRELVLNLMRAGEVFGEIALIDGAPRSADAVAMAPSELLVVERRDFLPLVEDRPGAAMRIISLLCRRLRSTSEQVEDVAFLDVSSRLAKALLRLSPTGGYIAITQRELGQLIGLSRESTNKQLQVWQRQKLLRLVKGGVHLIDLGTIEQLAFSAERPRQPRAEVASRAH